MCPKAERTALPHSSHELQAGPWCQEINATCPERPPRRQEAAQGRKARTRQSQPRNLGTSSLGVPPRAASLGPGAPGRRCIPPRRCTEHLPRGCDGHHRHGHCPRAGLRAPMWAR